MKFIFPRIKMYSLLNDKKRKRTTNPIVYENDSDYYSSDDNREQVSLEDIIIAFKTQRAKPIEMGYSSSDEDKMSLNQVVQTIKTNPCVILYSSWCGYSRRALDLLKEKKKAAKKIEIEDIQGSMDDIRNRLSNENLGFPKSYSSRPMIFMNGKFIGGYDQLSKKL